MAEGEALISIRDRLLKERDALLDLSARNRLLNIPLRTKNNRAIEVVDEKAAEVFARLSDGKAMTFLPGAGEDDDTAEPSLPQPDEAIDANGKAARHTDLKLQTRLSSEGLQKRLFDIWYDAQTLEQEQGVNILYLALGLLRWYDADASDTPRHAPLVLLPVRLERTSAADKFRLKGRDEPPSPNLTLQAKMKAEFGLSIEDFPDEDEVDLNAYAARITETIAGQKRWEVLPNAMVLGFFSFAKFLMYRDLDPQTWAEADTPIEDAGLIKAILRDGFEESEPLVGDTDRIDDTLPPGSLHHVVDADSSQTVAIAETVAGRTLVIKGPPGTGKSQTITNIIAGAVAAGKKVLFVAEKMAALDVVHRRLKAAGLGPLTLELHSNKVSKRSVLEELKRTREAAARPAPGDLTVLQRLDDLTQTLNGFADRLHTPLVPSGLSPQKILGRLAKWTSLGEPGRDFALTAAEDWTAADVTERRALAEDIAGRLAALGSPAAHVWRGVQCDALDPSERDGLARDIAKVREALHNAVSQAAVATRLLGAPTPVRISDLDRALAYLRLTPPPRDGDRTALADANWRNPKALTALIDTGEALIRLRIEARGLLNDAGLTADYTAIREDVVTKGSDLFRFLDGGFRRNMALLRSYVKGALPQNPDDRLKLIDLALRLQKTEATFEDTKSQATAFGRLWKEMDSDWDALRNVVNWRSSHNLPAEVWPLYAALPEAGIAEADQARQALYHALSDLKGALDGIIALLDLDLNRAFGASDTGALPLTALNERLGAWSDDLESLSRYIAFALRGRQLSTLGAGSLIDALHAGGLDGEDLMAAFDGAYSHVLRNVLFRDWPELKAFDGDAQDRHINQFRQLDRMRIELAKAQIAAQASDARPSGNAGIGPLGILNAELAKKRSHKPIRVLLDQAGQVIQDLKPVFMMSPLSVAQFLKPGGLQFDLLVMDEASQIEPVDALGAIARVKQLAVVGDERQLPPTAFFKKLTGEDETVEDEGLTLQARDAESILDLCLAKGAPHRMLNWHYRSKHQSLIAVSNREFYDNRLFIVPSPYDAVAGMGLKFHWLKDTVYDRGNTRTNPREARTVAEAVIHHARLRPEQTLGVATFSVAQRQAIQKELESLRRAHPELEPFFAEDATEPFFVKNLENIQGDERDVIFISVGYGKTEKGDLAHAFGPLSGEGGERRLNVLISRAKLRCEVFCNFRGADIDLERTQARGVAALKMFLSFAETGRFDTHDSEGVHDSEFEQQVAERLSALGHKVESQIGASGFRIDLAVTDPDHPGRFLIGIECDGAQYHSSRSARDRDRLRQQVLESHGWIIHRVWSADWYLRPKEELKKLCDAIAAAKTEWAMRDEEKADTDVAEAVAPPAAEAAPAPPAPVAEKPLLYIEADFQVNSRADPQSLTTRELAGVVTSIAAIEGPVHEDEIVARVRYLWDLPRTGPRLKAAVSAALRFAVSEDSVTEADGFYGAPDQAVRIRDRSQVTSAGLRKPDMLPPVEIEAAVIKVVDDNYGAARADLAPAAARLLGFATTGAALKTRIDDRVAKLETDGRLIEKNGLLVLP
jgi:very-short-patch-repair endonuclease